jgi:DNA end-binding protein Ku
MSATVWSGYVSFGLVSFPVRLHAAARSDAIHFHMLHRKDLSRVKTVWYCATEDKPVDRDDLVKGYEVRKNVYVLVEPEELKKIEPPTATTMEIVQFVRESEVDPIYLESSYYVAPGDKVGKPYALFARALATTKYSAIAKITMHTREHMVLIRSTGDALIMHTLYYPEELQEKNKVSVPSGAAASRKELDLAVELIRKLAAPFKPEDLHDTYRENLERLIEQKQKGEKIAAQPKPRRAPVVNLMEALQKSLQVSASPAKTRTAQAAKTSRRRKAA